MTNEFLIFSDRAFVLTNFEHYQSLFSHKILNITSLTVDRDDKSKEHLLVIYEEHNEKLQGRIAFFRWEPSEQQFVHKKNFESRKVDLATHRITNMKNLEYKNVEHLFIEVFELSTKTYNQYLLGFDFINLKWIEVLHLSSQYSRSFISLNTLNSTCLGSFSSVRPNILAHCNETDERVALKTLPNKMVRI